MGNIIQFPEQNRNQQRHPVGDVRNVPGEQQAPILKLARWSVGQNDRQPLRPFRSGRRASARVRAKPLLRRMS